MPHATAPERRPVKAEGSSRITFFLTGPQERELRRRMADAGERSITPFLVKSLGLNSTTPIQK